MQALVDTIIAFVQENERLAIPVAFLVAFGESFCFFSVVWPGTAILVGIAALLAASGISSSIVVPAILAASLGGALGYAFSYWIGYYFKDSIENVWPFRKNPELINKGELFFQKYGALSVFFGHFFGPIRAVIPVVAGMFAMRQIPFQIANIISALIWAAGVIAPAFFLVTFKDDVFAFLLNNEVLVAAALFLLAVALAIPHSMVFWPTLALFVGLGFLHLHVGGGFWPLWLAATGGAIVGDIAAYSIGETRRDDLLSLRFLNGGAEAVGNARDKIKEQGALAILGSKLGSISRSLVPMMAGAVSLNRATFSLASIFSSMLWAAVLLAPHGIMEILGL
ncbi:MAG: VTT domain-containing protein [Alphaproteobacteria bacterium]|nr:VTT domain-containing protein [Alphaproteobacteria bacterium]